MTSELTYDQLPPDKDNGPTILIVDDEEVGRGRLELILSGTDCVGGPRVLSCSSVPEMMEILSTTHVHVVLLDKNLGPDETLPEHNGILMISDIISTQPHLQVLVVTGSKDTDDVVHAMQAGAFGYVTKETPDDLLKKHIEKAIRMAKLELAKARQERLPQQNGISFVTASPHAQRLVGQIQAVSETNRPVLLLGETGTGKTTVARLIHNRRERYLKESDRPFIQVNIASLAPTLVEGELFGSEKGSFTGAHQTKLGFFELANNGTLFLDEIGEISLDIQKKLLTVLEEGTFYRLGGKKLLRSSFKLVCATNKNLRKMVAKGQFREDLYMRISTFCIEIPSLKDRLEDIPQLIKSLLPRCCEENNVHIQFKDIPADFIDFLTHNIPPGNIRGLEQQLSRLLVFAQRDSEGKPQLRYWKSIPGLRNRIRTGRPRSSFATTELFNRSTELIDDSFPGLAKFTKALEDKIVLEAITKFQSNKKVARVLGMAESSVSVRLKRLNGNGKASIAREGR